jgi:hypothetical protein
MYVRCRNCHDTIWLEPARGRSGPDLIGCRRCKQEYEFHIEGRAEDAAEDLGVRAQALASETGIDLPSAYSVLLGIAEIEDVFELHAAGVQPDAEKPSEVSVEAASGMRYDPAFREAVESGRLTATQAYQRGKREACAARLATRHRLPTEIAYAVADNRLPLLEALRQRAPETKPITVRIESRPRLGPRRFAVAATIVLALVIAGLHLVTRRPAETGGRSRVIVGEAEVVRNAAGRVVRVIATDPDAVLVTYCREGGAAGRLRAVGLMPAPSETTSVRIGLLREASRPDALQAIAIRKDPATDRWFSGDGVRPLTANLAPAGAVPVSER